MRLRKQTRAIKSSHLQQLEHTEFFDDSFLPEATEIKKLHALDPSILPWLKERAEKEQDFRHQVYNTRYEISERHSKRESTGSLLALIIYFVLVTGCGIASFILLKEGRNLQGSVFGGATVILALAVLVTRRSKRSAENRCSV